VDQLVQKVHKSYPGIEIAGCEASKFRRLTPEENECLLARIRASGADIIFVGLGCPRQETFVFENSGAVGRPLVAVGAAFDFHAGMLRQAPNWMQSAGLEWLFRLLVEPRRLWRRYAYLNPLFCALIVGEMVGIRRRRDDEDSFELERMQFG
jgi:exopolysaccharide biosynthesis WecB/TagA/CpsF family protein